MPKRCNFLGFCPPPLPSYMGNEALQWELELYHMLLVCVVVITYIRMHGPLGKLTMRKCNGRYLIQMLHFVNSSCYCKQMLYNFIQNLKYSYVYTRQLYRYLLLAKGRKRIKEMLSTTYVVCRPPIRPIEPR